jgi:hypothetical protein
MEETTFTNQIKYTSHQARLKKILDWGGAEIQDGIFITSPVVKIIKSTQLDRNFAELCAELNINSSIPDYLKSGEFNARLTYLAFPTSPESVRDSFAYVSKMIHEHQHLSVYNDFYVSFLIAGISDETMKELLAHVEHRASRLTSSKTKAQDSTFYRIQGTPAQQHIQKQFIREFLHLKAQHANSTEPNTTEFANMMNLPTKVCALVYSMSLKDLRKMIAGRLPEFGNETEIREVAELMQAQLLQNYPVVFSPNPIAQPKPETHYVNIEKYQKIVSPILQSVKNKVILDIGCAHGEIACALDNLGLFGHDLNQYFGWEIAADRIADQVVFNEYCDFIFTDYILDLENFTEPNVIIVSNPPYSELDKIMAHVTKYKLQYILMTNAKHAGLFVGAKLIGLMGPDDFTPRTNSSSSHMIFTNI